MEAFCHAAPVGGGLSTTGQEGNGSAQGDLLTDRELAREPAKEPERKWVNRWLLVRGVGRIRCARCDRVTFIGLGAEFTTCCCITYHSRDAAEAAAHKVGAFLRGTQKYLGAHPVSE